MEKKILPLRGLMWLLFVVLLLQVVLGTVAFLIGDDWTERGQIGDMFGVVNTLFSGLAFAGVIYTLLLQRHELELQRTMQARSYLHISLSVSRSTGAYWIARTTVDNRSGEPKRIANAVVLVGPEDEDPRETYNQLAAGAPTIARVGSTNEIAENTVARAVVGNGRALIPVPFYYSENIDIADERISYSVPVPSVSMASDTAYSVRFFVHGEEWLHRSTHDLIIPT